MPPILVYRGRPVTKEDIAFIRNLIANQPQDGRYALSRQICYAWNWVQPNGHIKDMVCRGLLLQLEKEGYIVLPPRKSTPRNPFLHRKPPEPVLVDESPLERSIKELFPITLQQVRRTPFEKLFNGLIAQYHYLGYTQPVGEHLKYLVFSHDRPIACLAWSSAPWHLGCRDRFIGWSPAVRKILRTGKGFIITRSTGWRPLSILSVLKEPVIRRPTGSCLARPLVVEKTTRPIKSTDPSNMSMATRLPEISEQDWGLRNEASASPCNL